MYCTVHQGKIYLYFGGEKNKNKTALVVKVKHNFHTNMNSKSALIFFIQSNE